MGRSPYRPLLILLTALPPAPPSPSPAAAARRRAARWLCPSSCTTRASQACLGAPTLRPRSCAMTTSSLRPWRAPPSARRAQRGLLRKQGPCSRGALVRLGRVLGLGCSAGLCAAPWAAALTRNPGTSQHCTASRVHGTGRPLRSGTRAGCAPPDAMWLFCRVGLRNAPHSPIPVAARSCHVCASAAVRTLFHRIHRAVPARGHLFVRRAPSPAVLLVCLSVLRTPAGDASDIPCVQPRCVRQRALRLLSAAEPQVRRDTGRPVPLICVRVPL